MPIHEIKNPVPQPEPAVPRGETPGQVQRPAPVIRIRRYQGRQEQAKRKSRGEQPIPQPAGDEIMLRRLLRQFNEDMERQRVPLHLVLIAEEKGYLLEMYDCTREKVCLVIRDLEIRPAEFPDLLHKLQREAGLLVDTFS